MSENLILLLVEEETALLDSGLCLYFELLLILLHHFEGVLVLP